jgi:hypothetical protein
VNTGLAFFISLVNTDWSHQSFLGIKQSIGAAQQSVNFILFIPRFLDRWLVHHLDGGDREGVRTVWPLAGGYSLDLTLENRGNWCVLGDGPGEGCHILAPTVPIRLRDITIGKVLKIKVQWWKRRPCLRTENAFWTITLQMLPRKLGLVYPWLVRLGLVKSYLAVEKVIDFGQDHEVIFSRGVRRDGKINEGLFANLGRTNLGTILVRLRFGSPWRNKPMLNIVSAFYMFRYFLLLRNYNVPVCLLLQKFALSHRFDILEVKYK